ncbi:MAG: RNase adapter RapZ [Gammaproteobacteria bacterium]|nr:RNase adapter RapZ [Gammaproteobacteria bacterium]MCI0590508.1 RNase adapter RapZ [Gammaproteobacteria bacterium]
MIIISGLSGAGKTVALNALEDLTYYCIDNLPLGLLSQFALEITNNSQAAYDRVAVGIDARNTQEALQHLPQAMAELRVSGLATELVFIEAGDDTLIERFSETRRRHPLSSHSMSLADAIQMERRLLAALAESADIRIDTSRTRMHELRDVVRERIARRPRASLSLQLVSFGYKHGVPRDADFVFDVRCLPNPYWETHLRPLSGRDKAVIEFLENQPLVASMLEQLTIFLRFWVPQFEAGNRSYLTVAIGCTGGNHRSVYLVEQLSEIFSKQLQHVLVRHRDI